MKTNILKKYLKHFLLIILLSLNLSIKFTPTGISIGMKQAVANQFDYGSGWVDWFLSVYFYYPGIYTYVNDNWSFCPECAWYLNIQEVVCYGTSIANTPINLNYSNIWRSMPLANIPQFSYYDSGTGGWQSAPSSPPGTPSSQSATRILANSNVDPATGHKDPRGAGDNANAKQNLIDASNGNPVSRSCYGNAPCGTTTLKLNLLTGIEALAASGYSFSISEIAGGSHSATSLHYNGVAIDVNSVNGVHVGLGSMTEAEIIAFRNAAYSAGATNVLDPLNAPQYHSNHFHIEWGILEY
jgi:hypothetical protein